MVPLMATFRQAALRDFTLLVPAALAVASGLLLWMVRAWPFTLALLSVVTTTGTVTVGLATLGGHTFNTATVIVPIIVGILTLAAGLHIVLSISAQAQHLSTQDRISGGLRQVRWPSIVALVTTLIGFVSFNYAQAPPLRELGNLVRYNHP